MIFFLTGKIYFHFGGENDGVGKGEDVGVGGDDGGCHGDDRDNKRGRGRRSRPWFV